MKIATLTLNPALDRTMYFGDDIKIGALNRAKTDKQSVTTIGGKGTNVSCMFKILGIESTAYGFIGGENGNYFQRMLSEYKFNMNFTRTACNSRMNIKIITESGGATEFNEAGGIISHEEKSELLEKIEKDLHDTDLFFMGGSVPVGVEKSIYKDIINLTQNQGTKFIIDCDGEALKLCMSNAKKPYIIKPNQFELEQYSGKKFNLDGDFYTALSQVKREIKKIYDDTGVIVLCTLGEYGGLYCGTEGIFYKKSPKVEVRGFSGAGDTFLTAFCAVCFGLYKYGDNGAKDALDFAVAASSAKVTKRGTEFPSLGEIYAIMNNEILVKIDESLRSYDLMVIETGGKYDGQGIIDKCLILADSYIAMGGCIDDIYHIIDTIVKQYEEMQKSHKWKYHDNMVGLLNAYKDKLHSK